MRIAVDSSAVLAILFEEEDAGQYLAKLLEASTSWISAVNWWEVQVCARSRKGEAGQTESAEIMQSVGLIVEAVTQAQAKIAVETSVRYQGRPARLNMGDCFAYALARSKGVPLLYKGSDFSRSDIDAA